MDVAAGPRPPRSAKGASGGRERIGCPVDDRDVDPLPQGLAAANGSGDDRAVVGAVDVVRIGQQAVDAGCAGREGFIGARRAAVDEPGRPHA